MKFSHTHDIAKYSTIDPGTSR